MSGDNQIESYVFTLAALRQLRDRMAGWDDTLSHQTPERLEQARIDMEQRYPHWTRPHATTAAPPPPRLNYIEELRAQMINPAPQMPDEPIRANDFTMTFTQGAPTPAPQQRTNDMPIVREFTITPNQRQRQTLEGDIATYTYRAHQYRTAVDRDNARLPTIIDSIDYWQQLRDRELPHNRPPFVSNDVAIGRETTFANFIYTLENQRDDIIRNRTGAQRHLAAAEDTLSSLRMQLSQLPAARTSTITSEQAKRAFAGPHMQQLRLLENGSRKIIRVTYKNLILRPDSNRYSWVNEGRNDVRIKLQPIIVDIDLGSGYVHARPVRGMLHRYGRGMAGGHQAHPHVTSHDGSTCLGDFGGPITEAVHTLDLSLINDLVLMFLQQAAAEDAAGQHWIRFLSPENMNTGVYLARDYCQRHDDAFLFFRTDNEGNVTMYHNNTQEWPAQADGTPEPAPLAVTDAAEPATEEEILENEPEGYPDDDIETHDPEEEEEDAY